MNKEDIITRIIKVLFIIIVFEFGMLLESFLCDSNIYDINGDDKVDVNDVIVLSRYINKHNKDEVFDVQIETDEDGATYVVVNGE